MIEMSNVELLYFKDMLIENKEISREKVAEIDINQDVPIQLRVGAVNYQIGIINRLRKGANAMTGDLFLHLKGKLIVGLEGDTVKPIAYRFVVDST